MANETLKATFEEVLRLKGEEGTSDLDYEGVPSEVDQMADVLLDLVTAKDHTLMPKQRLIAVGLTGTIVANLNLLRDNFTKADRDLRELTPVIRQAFVRFTLSELTDLAKSDVNKKIRENAFFDLEYLGNLASAAKSNGELFCEPSIREEIIQSMQTIAEAERDPAIQNFMRGELQQLQPL